MFWVEVSAVDFFFLSGVFEGVFNGAFEGVLPAGELFVDGGRTETAGDDRRGRDGVWRATFLRGDPSFFSGEPSFLESTASFLDAAFSFAIEEADGDALGEGAALGGGGRLVLVARLGRGLTGRATGGLTGGDRVSFAASFAVADPEERVALLLSSLWRRFRVPRRTGDGGTLAGAVDTSDETFGLYLGSALGCCSTLGLGLLESLPFALAGAGGLGASSGSVASFLSSVGVDDERETRPEAPGPVGGLPMPRLPEAAALEPG